MKIYDDIKAATNTTELKAIYQEHLPVIQQLNQDISTAETQINNAKANLVTYIEDRNSLIDAAEVQLKTDEISLSSYGNISHLKKVFYAKLGELEKYLIE